MKNYWLDKNKWTEPEVRQAALMGSWVDGMWYIVRYIREELEWDRMWRRMGDGCALTQQSSENSLDSYFLHKDGTWVKNSLYKDDNWKPGDTMVWERCEYWSGYYDTREEAKATLEKYK